MPRPHLTSMIHEDDRSSTTLLVIRNTLPSPHVSPFTSYVSRPLKGKVISPWENGIL